MSNSALEIKLTSGGPIIPGENVVFDEPISTMTGVEYDKTSGVITFHEIGKYSVKWWVATETTLKGTIGFHLTSKGATSEEKFIPGCSPIKTGQVTGFGIVDVGEVDTKLRLVNRSTTDTVISRKAGTKGYLQVTPLCPTPVRVYHGNLSTSGSFLQVPLGNGLYYRLENINPTQFRLVFTPMNGPTTFDYRRFCSFDGGGAVEGNRADNATLNGLQIMDTPMYNSSQEMHWTLIRVLNPQTNLWSLYEVRLFASNGLVRVTVWVNTIEEEVSY